MPLNKKGKKIKAAMEKTYGKKKGQTVFYASANKGTIKGVERKLEKQKNKTYIVNMDKETQKTCSKNN